MLEDNDMLLKNITEEDAKIICEWEYFEAYSIYNINGWENAVNRVDKKRNFD